MDILKFDDYEGTAELDMDRKVCRGKLLFIDDLVTYEASDPVKLQAEFEAAVSDYIETCKALGKEPQKAFKGLFNVRVPPALHRAGALRACQDGVGLNDVVVRALDAFLNGTGEVQQNIRITFESGDPVRTLTSVASSTSAWEQISVH